MNKVGLMIQCIRNVILDNSIVNIWVGAASGKKAIEEGAGEGHARDGKGPNLRQWQGERQGCIWEKLGRRNESL